MARIAGRNGRAYINITSGGTAEALAYVSSWSINASTPKIGVTTMGDSNEVTVNGLPNATGSLSGFWDNASAQTYTAATDGVARKFYLYPDASSAAVYWWGTINVDFSASATVDGAVTFSADWSAASNIAKVG